MNAQSRKTKSSEEQISQAPSEEDFVGLIKYIREREKGLSRYSDKLRRNLNAIANIFGSATICQVCGYADKFYANNVIDLSSLKLEENPDERGVGKLRRKYVNEYKTHDALAEMQKDGVLDKNFAVHAFTPKINISLDVADDAIFCDESDDDEHNVSKLCIRNGALIILQAKSDKDLEGTEYEKLVELCWNFNQVSRSDLKYLVRSGRLPKFLALVAQKLAEAEAEYGEVSAMAEKMAKAIEPGLEQ